MIAIFSRGSCLNIHNVVFGYNEFLTNGNGIMRNSQLFGRVKCFCFSYGDQVAIFFLMLSSLLSTDVKAGMIHITGPTSVSISVFPELGQVPGYKATYTADPGATFPGNAWVFSGQYPETIEDKGGDPRIQLLYYRPSTASAGTVVGAGDSGALGFSAAYVVNGPNEGMTLIHHDYLVHWSLPGGAQGLGFSQATGTLDINVRVYGLVPEPSSFALLGLGGIFLAIGAHRRRRFAVRKACPSN